MNSKCKNCYKYPINWDCNFAIEDQIDYEYDEGAYEWWDNGLFYKDDL